MLVPCSHFRLDGDINPIMGKKPLLLGRYRGAILDRELVAYTRSISGMCFLAQKDKGAYVKDVCGKTHSLAQWWH